MDDAKRAARRLRLLGDIAEARDADMAHEAMDRLIAELGLSSWGFAGHVIGQKGVRIEAVAGSPVAMKATEAYADADLAFGDPMFRALMSGAEWVTATDMIRDPQPRDDLDRRDEVVRLIHAHHLTNLGGFAVDGVRGDAGFLSAAVRTTAQAETFDAICAQNHNLLRLAGTALAAKLAGFDRKPPLLTGAERGVLERLAHGEKPDEIAASTGKSIRTVRHQIESARQRLGAPTTIAAVAMALEFGEIMPPPDRF